MAEIVIIGGGVIGCATALHLLHADAALDVAVIEPDSTYAYASSTRASVGVKAHGGVRQLFAEWENVLLSQYTLDVIQNWEDFVGVEGKGAPDIGWSQAGYLFISGDRDAKALRSIYDVQRTNGGAAEWLEAGDLKERFACLATEDLVGGILSSRDGLFDPCAFLFGMRRKAESLGARFVEDRVVDLTTSGFLVREVQLASGRPMLPDVVINAAGCWAPGLARRVGMPLPIEPMRRFEHYVEARENVRSLPFVKDMAGLAVRPEGAGLVVGLVDYEQPGGFDLDIDRSYFERRVWPALVHRFPPLEGMRLRSTWAGLYDQNRLDGNVVIGNWPGRLDNFYIATGFSGHGLMHAPGVGRALSELVIYGEYQTIDLSNFGYKRIVQNRGYSGSVLR